jgi:hypothetical protein
MAKIISDNLAYAKVVKQMGFRTNSAATDFSEILPEDLEEVLKASAQISMGTEISATDLQHIHLLADQVISISNYRAELYSYLTNRMQAIAPGLDDSDPRGREGTVPGTKDKARHAEIRSHLPRQLGRAGAAKTQGKGGTTRFSGLTAGCIELARCL